MRHLLLGTALALTVAPAFADQIEAKAPVSAVTVYPWGASVTRQATLAAPPGKHELILTGLPQDLDPSSLRLSAEGTGVKIGAVSVQESRALPPDPKRRAEIDAAEAELHRQESVLNQHHTRIATIRARAAAAEDMVTFLLSLAQSDGAGASDVPALLGSVSGELLKAREAIVAAEAEAREADQARAEIDRALEAARARFEALNSEEDQSRALIVTVETTGAEAKIDLTSFSSEASWQPVYDARLARKEGKLSLDRGMMISQSTGEDWRDVKLTLSTARPAVQFAPTELQPLFPEVSDPNAGGYAQDNAVMAPAPMARMKVGAEMEAMVDETVAAPRWLGATVVYDFPEPVTIRSDADALRIELDSRDFSPTVRAEAVPARDATAFLVAETKNTLDEVLLPGAMTLYSDGAMVGRFDLPLTASGDEMTLGFGPIDGLVAEYELPEEARGDSGILSKSSTSHRAAILRVRNLTSEDWPLRIIGQVPVSTQDDLKISWSADPSPTTQDRDGQRGILEWDDTLAAGAVKNVTLTVDMRWPEGKILTGEE